VAKKDSPASTEATKTAAKYTKQQIVTSNRFAPVERDILSVLLKDEETYTLDQARAVLEEFARKEVR